MVTIPLAPRTARAIDLAVGERLEGPVFLGPDGRRLDRHGAARIVRKVAARAGISKPVGPHTLRHAFITAALDGGVPLRDVQQAASHAGPQDHDPLRPCPRQPRQARHLHRRRLRRRCRPVRNRQRSSGLCLAGRPGQAEALSVRTAEIALDRLASGGVPGRPVKLGGRAPWAGPGLCLQPHA